MNENENMAMVSDVIEATNSTGIAEATNGIGVSDAVLISGVVTIGIMGAIKLVKFGRKKVNELKAAKQAKKEAETETYEGEVVDDET